LTGLDVSGLTQLREIYCSKNKLTSDKLKIDGVNNLEKFSCYKNHLSDLHLLLFFLNPERLTNLDIRNNNFTKQDLTIFSRFTNLQELRIGNDNEEKIKENEYNRFVGSLSPLKRLVKLESLHVSNTDISGGLGFLPDGLGKIYCSTEERPESKIGKLLEESNSSFILDGDKYVRKITVQQAFEEKYSDKEAKIIDLSELNFNTETDLTITGFPNLKEIKNSDYGYIYKIDQLNINNCPRLNKVDIRYLRNNKELNINNCENLAEVNCYYNQLEKLNINNCPKIEDLDCSDNRLNELNLQELTNLKKLDCSDNPTVRLDIPEQIPSLEEVIANKELSETNDFLKSSFIFYNKYMKKKSVQEWLDENFPKEGVSKLAGYEGKKRSEIKELDIGEKGLVGKLKIEGFSELEKLDCSQNELSNLDIRDCPDLKEIYCYENGLTILDLNNCTKLNKVYCYLNQLAELELGNLNDLSEFSCYGNNLTNCDFVKQLNPKKITLLSIRDNNFAEQNLEIISDFVNLETLRLENTDKERIEKGVYNRFYGSLEHLKGISKLERLGISNTDLDSGVEYLPESIKEIYCSVEERPECKLKVIKKELDLYQERLDTHNTKKRLNEMYPDKSVKVLDNLWLESLKGHLDLSEYEALEKLDCHNNRLTSINLSNCPKLKYLDCSDNQLTELDLSNLTQLEEICCYANELTELRLSNLPKINKFYCKNNYLTEINYLALNPESLTELSIRNNDLTEQDISIFSKFVNLQDYL